MRLVEKLGRVLIQESLNLLSNPEIRQQAQDIIQEVSGNVNRDTLEQAVEKACTSCTKKSVDDQLSVIAFVTALYMQNDINRAAQVGGSLRKRFGITWFPHIKERELRYALDVNEELVDFFYQELSKNK
jgi:hypothetical protein